MALSVTIGVNANLSDSVTGLNVTGVGSAILNLGSALGVSDITLAPGSLNVPIPLPTGVSAAQFVFLSAQSVPDLQVTAPGMTYGTSTSNSGAPTSIAAGLMLTLNLDGDGSQSIQLAANTSGTAIAADIQAKVRALTPAFAVNALAYAGFTCTYTGSAYVLTSGVIGNGSSVVVTSASTGALALLLGTGNGGVESAGSGGNSAQLPQGAGTVFYNPKQTIYISTLVGGLIQYAVGG